MPRIGPRDGLRGDAEPRLGARRWQRQIVTTSPSAARVLLDLVVAEGGLPVLASMEDTQDVDYGLMDD